MDVVTVHVGVSGSLVIPGAAQQHGVRGRPRRGSGLADGDLCEEGGEHPFPCTEPTHPYPTQPSLSCSWPGGCVHPTRNSCVAIRDLKIPEAVDPEPADCLSWATLLCGGVGLGSGRSLCRFPFLPRRKGFKSVGSSERGVCSAARFWWLEATRAVGLIL